MATNQKVPPIINCKPIIKKDNRTLVWLHDAIPSTKINVYDGIVSSIADYMKWQSKTNIIGVVLLKLEEGDFEIIRKHKINVFLTKAIFETRRKEDWLGLGVSIGILEELADQFPVIPSTWDGTLADAIACISLLFHYCVLYIPEGTVLSTERDSQFTNYGIRVRTDYKAPPEIWLITQYFMHKVTKRAREFRQCLKNNFQCKYLDRIVLLNESDLKYDWSGARGSEKVHQEIIKTRLTYKDLIKYVYDSVPPGTLVIFANADIYCNDTLKQLYTVNMEDKLFALLRWDEQDGTEELKLFGPRPDSQDAWICLSDDIKKRTWAWESFNYKLGTAGCDNRFTSDMFQMKFLIANPCQTIQTVHLHKTAIRDYNPTDIVPARLYMYIHPCALMELNQDPKGIAPLFSLSPRRAVIGVRGLSPKKLQTFCIMLARENRFKWNETALSALSLSPLSIAKWSNSFVTNAGVVYDYNRIYLGDRSDEFIQKVGRDLCVSYVNPCERVNTMLAIPCPTIAQMTNPDLYCLHYLSYVLQIYEQLGEEEKPSLFVVPALIPTLQAFMLRKGIRGAVPAVAWSPGCAVYAQEIIGYLPEVAELSINEIRALRKAWPEWVREVGRKCVVLVDEILSPEFVEGAVKGLLPEGWSVEQVLRTSYGLEAFRQMVGAGLCILYNLPKQEEHWAKLWALPLGCPVLEFQNELKVEGGCQQLIAAAELNSWLFPLHKGSIPEVRDQVLTGLKEWFTSTPKGLSPTDTFLSI